MLQKTRALFCHPVFIGTIFILMAAVGVGLKIMLDLQPHEAIGYISKINNFIIYRNSYYHLVQHNNLYGYFPAEQYDEFLYSPTFALLIAPFAWLPAYAGVICWCVFNALAVYVAIRCLAIDEKKKTFICWFVLIELLTSIQNVQVNPLVCALFLLTFTAFEKQKTGLAAFFVVLSVFIKVFGILGAALFLLYPGRLKFILYCLLWAAVLFLLPLLVISFDELITLYRNWFETLAGDHAKNVEDVSVMKMLAGISGHTFSEQARLLIQLAAVLLFCVQYLTFRSFEHKQVRLFFLASAMIWSIIFNHAAESSTYIIAVAGAAIWYVSAEKNTLNTTLIILAFVLCVLSPTDLFPRQIRLNYVVPMALKALPCFLIWLRIGYDLLSRYVVLKPTS